MSLKCHSPNNILLLVLTCFIAATNLGDYLFLCIGQRSNNPTYGAVIDEIETVPKQDQHLKVAVADSQSRSKSEVPEVFQDKKTALYYASAIFERAELLDKQQQFVDAYKWARLAAKIVGPTCGFNSPEYARCLDLMGRINLSTSDYVLAERNLEIAYSIVTVQTDSHWSNLRIGVTCNLGCAKRKLSKYIDAQELFELALQDMSRLEQTAKIEQATCVMKIYLGNVFLDSGDHKRGAELIETEFNSIEENEEKDERLLILALRSMAGLHYIRQEYKESEKFLSKTLELTLRKYGNQSIKYADILEQFAELRIAQGRSTSATHMLDQAITLRKNLLGTSHPTVESSSTRLQAIKKNNLP